MKPRFYLLIFLLAITNYSFAQWSTSGTTVYKTNSAGNVGIGTSTPTTRLEIYGLGSNLQLNSQGGAYGINSADLKFKAGTLQGSVSLTTLPVLGLPPGLVLTASDISVNTANTFRVFTPNIYGIPIERFTLLKDGKVGIGNATPAFTMDISGPINATGLFVNGTAVALGVTAVSPWTLDGSAVNYNNGNVGIGILSNVPTYKLDVNGTINATGFLLNGAPLSTSQWTTAGSVIYYNGGNIGIGTVTPGSYKLNVWGSLRAHEIVVNTTGADFVFEDGYKLRPLEEVERFINEHKHLPEILPAQQMQKEGMKMGDTQTKLLQKIEELTLYMIELKKDLEKVKRQNELLAAKINK